MSFGFAIGDFIILSQLASRVVQGARQACGAHDELTREVASLHVVLRVLEREVSKSTSILTSKDDDRKNGLATLVEHCNQVLGVLEKVLKKYNGLSAEQKKAKKLWKSIKFGNGEMVELSKIRLELATHTNAITIFLNLLSVGSAGRIEEQLSSQDQDWRDLKKSIHWITASLQAESGHTVGSILTSYTDDDKTFWRELRRELVQEGYSSRTLKKHKRTIQNYVKELGERGALDDLPSLEDVTIKDGNESDNTPGGEGTEQGNSTNDLGQKNVSRQIETPERCYVTKSNSPREDYHSSQNPILPLNKSDGPTTVPSNNSFSSSKIQNPGEPSALDAKCYSKQTSFYHQVIGDPEKFKTGFIFVLSSNLLSTSNQVSLHGFARRYIESTELRDWRRLPTMIRLRANETHTTFYGLPYGTDISRWDPNYKPLLIHGIAFDHFSIGKWVYDWDVERWGAESEKAKSSARIWVALSKLSSVAHLYSKRQNNQCLREWGRQANDLLQEFTQRQTNAWRESKQLVHSKSEESVPYLPAEQPISVWTDKTNEWNVGFRDKWRMVKKTEISESR